MRKLYIVFYLLAGALMVSGVATNIYIANLLVGSGNELNKIDSTISSLTLENDLLEQKVASASSLSQIDLKARQYGFVERSSKQLLTLTKDHLPVALAPIN